MNKIKKGYDAWTYKASYNDKLYIKKLQKDKGRRESVFKMKKITRIGRKVDS